MSTSIYGLMSNRDNVIRYIGKTTNPVARMTGHHGYDPAQPEKSTWVAGETAAGYTISMVILLEGASGYDEQRFLDVYGAYRPTTSHRLFNSAGTPYIHREPTKPGTKHGTQTSERAAIGDLVKSQGISTRDAIRMRRGLE